MMIGDSLLTSHSPMQDVAPSAVRIALAMDTIICAINFAVSFLLIFTSFLFYPFTFLLFNLILGAALRLNCPQVEINRRADRLQDPLESE